MIKYFNLSFIMAIILYVWGIIWFVFGTPVNHLEPLVMMLAGQCSGLQYRIEKLEEKK